MGPSFRALSNSYYAVTKLYIVPLQYLREEEGIAVDPNKIAMEHAALCEFHSLQEHSVPRVYLLDTQRKAST